MPADQAAAARANAAQDRQAQQQRDAAVRAPSIRSELKHIQLFPPKRHVFLATASRSTFRPRCPTQRRPKAHPPYRWIALRSPGNCWTTTLVNALANKVLTY